MTDFKIEVINFLKECKIIFSLTARVDGFDFPESEVIFIRDNNLVIQLFELYSVSDTAEHQATWREVNNRGFKLIRIWRDQWQFKRDIVCSRLISLLHLNNRLPARACKVKRIDKETAELFLNQNHLQGYAGSKLKYGLYLPESYYRLLSKQDHTLTIGNEELLVAAMTFSNPRKYYLNDKIISSYELIRFGTLMNFSVTGGFNKLLDHFVREKHPGNIMTYADADWSDGKTYRQLGFDHTDTLAPMAFGLDERNQRIPDSRRPVAIYNSGSFKFIKTFERDDAKS